MGVTPKTSSFLSRPDPIIAFHAGEWPVVAFVFFGYLRDASTAIGLLNARYQRRIGFRARATRTPVEVLPVPA